MATIGLDTHKAVKALTEVGFSEPQAETVVSTLREVLGGDIATKTDIQTAKSELEANMKDLELRLTLRIGGMIIAAVSVLVAAMAIFR